MQRADAIADACLSLLPDDAEQQLRIIIAALGPVLPQADGNGLKPFFYLPLSKLIERYAVQISDKGADIDPDIGLEACYQLTRRFTAEFAIRPYLVAHPDQALSRLAEWQHDPCVHVRRLVSEGTSHAYHGVSDSNNFNKIPVLYYHCSTICTSIASATSPAQ